MTRLVLVALVVPAILAGSRPAEAQPAGDNGPFRVFLADGRALPSISEYVVVGDRLVFVLPIGAGGADVQQQLMSLPLTSIDMPRTTQYAEAVRARQYADLRGPAEYSQMTAEVSETLAAIEKEPDPKRRLAMAEEARRRLVAWPKDHYGYRASEVHELAGMFSDVITEMQRSAGQTRYALDLMAGPVIPGYPPPLPSLGLRESIELALAAAAAADTASDRPAILRAALAALSGAAGQDDLRAEVSRRLQVEVAADAAYATLATQLATLAEAAMRRGDVKGVEAAQTQLAARDLALGLRRPQEVKALAERLQAALARARAHRAALDHFAEVGARLYRYERDVRPVLSALDGLQPVLEHIRDSKYMSYERIIHALGRLVDQRALVERIEAPPDVQSVHSTLRSAILMALQACDRRRQVDVGPNPALEREAAAAAAGTLLLAAQARQDLLARLVPPKFQ